MKNITILIYFLISTNLYSQNLREINSNNVLSYFSKSASITNKQLGSNNSIELLISNPVKNISINQFGVNNNLNYFDYINQNIVIENEVIMKGNNNSMIISGSNKIFQNMSIEIKGNDKKITVINR